MKLRYIAGLLIAGIAVGIALPGRLAPIFGDATLYVFLPALIFEAAWHLDLHVMRRRWKPIVLLALPGVAITAGIVAACVHYLGVLAWAPGLVLGAILSATDPVAVIAIFRRLPVPRALATIIESESLLNDAIAVVLYRAVLAAAIASGGVAAVWQPAALAIAGVAIGIGVGVVAAFVAAYALRDAISTPIQSAATFAGAYGTYLLLDRFGWSGIFGVLTFGIVLRELERHRISVASAAGVEQFWDRVALVANLALFLLIGTALDLRTLVHSLPAAGVTLGAVALARTVLAYGLLRFARSQLRPFWMAVVNMAGIRGALSLALALATPQSVPQRGVIIDATFAVVVVTILAGSLALRPGLERLPLQTEEAQQHG